MKELNELRNKIDEIDAEIIEKLCIRVETARHIGAIKKNLGMEIRDHERENLLRRRWEELSMLYELPSDKILTILDKILELSRDEQVKVR